jgi:hypothetical protein
VSQNFLFPYTVPSEKNRYGWDIQFVPVPDFLIFKDEIDLGNPVKLDFKYWNITPTGGFIHDPELTEDTIFVYDWGAMVGQSGTTNERDPLEYWNLAEGDAGIGHAVTAVGYLENYVPPDTNYVIVHDDWANTPKNIAIPWIDINIMGWFFYHLPEPPDLAVTNIQTANDTSLGFTDSLQIHKPVTVAVNIHNQGKGGTGAGQYMCTTSVLDPLGNPVITNRRHPQITLYPQGGVGQDSTVVYFDSLFTPTMTGGYEISSVVYWDMNGDSLENDSPEPNLTNNTLVINAQVYIRTNLPINVPDDFTTIQAAIDASSDGNTILVDEGIYYENINFKGKAITVASRYWFDGDTSHISKTIIDGSQPADPDSGSVVLFISGEDTTSVLCGFTITGGTGTIYDAMHRVGGGIYCKNSGARIVHNKIFNNSVSHNQESLGGGIGTYPRQSLKHVIIENNVIDSNSLSAQICTLGGGIFLDQGRIRQNLISNNISPGGASYVGFGGGIACSCDTTIARTTVRIIGNTIINNQASSPSANSGGVGGGVAVDFCTVEIIENHINHNKVSGVQPDGGAGVRLLLSQMSIVQDNIISFNFSSNQNGLVGMGGGLNAYQTSSLIIRGNRFEGNKSVGGGGVFEGQTHETELSENQFVDNYSLIGGGIHEASTTNSIISGNRFISNKADYFGGGIMIEECSPGIYNNLINDNDAVVGGGAIFMGDQNCWPEIINNTIIADSAGEYGGGICINLVSPVVMNSILYDNWSPIGSQIHIVGGDTMIAYCDIQGGFAGTGNIDRDPGFIDSLFNLSDTSWCVGNGADSVQVDGNWYFAPSIDYYGNLRPHSVDSYTDMGAVESPYPRVPIPPVNIKEDDLNLPLKFALYQNYPNPFNPKTTIRYSVGANGHSPLQHVDLSIYNILGQKVATLVDKNQPAGSYQIELDASGFASGVYLFRLETDNGFEDIKKMVLLK